MKSSIVLTAALLLPLISLFSTQVRHWWHWTWFQGSIQNDNCLIFQASASSQGVFELKLTNFVNRLGKGNDGQCCSGYRTASGKCSGVCATKFRVCLKHYQATIDPQHECTFGEHFTPVLGHNSAIRAPVISFPLDFKWPVSTSIKVLNFCFFKTVRVSWQCQSLSPVKTNTRTLPTMCWEMQTLDWCIFFFLSFSGHLQPHHWSLAWKQQNHR